MKASTFFKILNKKIEKYDKMASNPFLKPHSIVIIWIEDEDDFSTKNNKDYLN